MVNQSSDQPINQSIPNTISVNSNSFCTLDFSELFTLEH